MESLGTMAGGIAHDFNNLLGSILGYTRMGLLDAPPGSKLERRLNQVMKAGKLAQDLVRQILTFSREGNRMTGPINPAPIIKETLKLLTATQPKNIELTHLYKPEAEIIAEFTRSIPSQLQVTQELILTMLRRRPCTSKQIADGFDVHFNEVLKYLDELMRNHYIRTEFKNNNAYYVAVDKG